MNDVATGAASETRREWRSRSLHALNSPLGAILAQAELVQLLVSRGRTASAIEAATNIVGDCERYGRMLRDAFAAADAIDTWSPGYCTVAEALDLAAGSLEGDDIALEAEGRDVVLPWPAPVAASFLSRCFDNARRHGARRIGVTATTDRGALRLLVRDDGTGLQGVSAEAALRSFVSSTPATHTGLGLWIAQALAHRVGGELFLPPTEHGFLVECRLPAGPIR
ncbi:hypothetical protein L2Y94_10640 [Luteibacter aegosomatis]|uniref:sensor histidine kinase n=1 Tax=Luteibacter aegosomatis TaxID=2911537 RepID=UPI001FFB02F7|nr:ATP-binding protein [Luteibacter aegosomatis]UPG87786.1 hypothetical protein L2Y94_10640 [Luteibacter aegosomatis]